MRNVAIYQATVRLAIEQYLRSLSAINDDEVVKSIASERNANDEYVIGIEKE
jgi:hypothetical protein